MVVNIYLALTRKRRRPQKELMDVAKEGMQRVGVTKRDVRDRVRWGTPV